MAEKEKFSNFIVRILESSHLQIAAGLIQKAFKEEIFINAEEIHKYVTQMTTFWEQWKKKSGIDFISRFIEDLGSTVFTGWLSSIYPFNVTRIEVHCPRGPSSVDSILQISYQFDKNELKIINNLLLEHSIAAQEADVAKTLFIESIKSISDVFSQIIKQPYKIFTSEVNMIKKKGFLQVEYKGAGRVVT